MFKENNVDKIKYLTIEEFEKTGLVRHAFSTRIGGVSTGEAATMNFGLNRKDTRDNIKKNFRLLLFAIGANFDNMVFTNQVHGNNIHVVKKEDAGKGLLRESDIIGVDALITNERNIPICIFHADCMPFLFVDPVKKAIGVAHSGWKGTLLNIAAKTVSAMTENFGSDPKDILCGIGPSIGECHFEVDEDVAKLFDESFVSYHEKPHVDLWGVGVKQLLDAGLKKENIIVSNICTYCNKDLFYSYRGDNHKTGSMVSVLELI